MTHKELIELLHDEIDSGLWPGSIINRKAAIEWHKALNPDAIYTEDLWFRDGRLSQTSGPQRGRNIPYIEVILSNVEVLSLFFT